MQINDTLAVLIFKTNQMKKANTKKIVLHKSVISKVTSAHIKGGLVPTTLIFTVKSKLNTKTECK